MSSSFVNGSSALNATTRLLRIRNFEISQAVGVTTELFSTR
jgi:hypothetical protein